MQKEKISIHTPFIKLDQLLKFSGIAETGGDAKDMIYDGIVSVNKKAATERGKKIHPGDVVEVRFDDELLVIDVTADE